MTTTALYDVPGPRTRQRHRLYGVGSTVVILALIGWIIYLLFDTGQFSAREVDSLRLQGNSGAAAARASATP